MESDRSLRTVSDSTLDAQSENQALGNRRAAQGAWRGIVYCIVREVGRKIEVVAPVAIPAPGLECSRTGVFMPTRRKWTMGAALFAAAMLAVFVPLGARPG